MRTRSKLTAASRMVARAAGISIIAGAGFAQTSFADDGRTGRTATPIKHLVVIFQENVSFDHYFATYPFALNPPDEPFFEASDGTPSVNGLGRLVNGVPDGVLLTDNPNANNSANGANAINPFRLDRSQASTCDQDHAYGDEQKAFHQGLMDLFPASVGAGASSFCAATFAYGKGKGLVMGYFDGNTVTATWNYAQNFAMNDNSYGTTFGPSTPGLLNLVAGNTFSATPSAPSTKVVPNNAGPGTLVGDLDPTGDVCSSGTTAQLSGPNIGDLLSAQKVTWGAFMGGFDPTIKNSDGSTGCNRQSPATPANGGPTKDYIPHHAFFQYFASTRNPAHTRPTSPAVVGTKNDGGANHQYDLNDFFDALAIGNLPAVSFLKAIAAADGHAGYSDPLLEQSMMLVPTINAIMRSPFWSHGHHRHVRRFGRLVRPSDEPDRQLFSGLKHGFSFQRRSVERVRRLRQWHASRRYRGALRLWAAASAHRDLAVRQAEFRRPHADRPKLGPALHRGQLGHGPDRRRVV